MIDSYSATYILIAFLIIFGVLLPILDRVPKIKNFVSLRWTLIVVYSALCIGVIIDFEHLDGSVRFAVVIGGIVLSALFILVRSLEKGFINKWHFPHVRTSVAKGNLQAELSVSPKTKQSEKQQDDKNKSPDSNVENKISDNSELSLIDDSEIEKISKLKKARSLEKQRKLAQFIQENQNSPEYNKIMNNSLLFTDKNNKNNNDSSL